MKQKPLPFVNMNDDDTPIPDHYHLNLVIENPLKVKFVLTNENFDVTIYMDLWNGESVCVAEFDKPDALPFQDLITQVEPMYLESCCMILSDEMIITNYIKNRHVKKLMDFFPDYKMQSLSELGSESDMVVIAQHESIEKLIAAIKRNFIYPLDPTQD